MGPLEGPMTRLAPVAKGCGPMLCEAMGLELAEAAGGGGRVEVVG